MKWIEVGDYAAMGALAAERLFAVILEKVQAGKPVNIGLATGNTMIGTYHLLAGMLNKSGVNLAVMTTFNLDEYIGPDHCNVASSHPLSYRAYMRKEFFGKLNPELGFCPDKIMFPDAADAPAYDTEIAGAGGIDFQLLGSVLTGTSPSTSLSRRPR